MRRHATAIPPTPPPTTTTCLGGASQRKSEDGADESCDASCGADRWIQDENFVSWAVFGPRSRFESGRRANAEQENPDSAWRRSRATLPPRPAATAENALLLRHCPKPSQSSNSERPRIKRSASAANLLNTGRSITSETSCRRAINYGYLSRIYCIYKLNLSQFLSVSVWSAIKKQDLSRTVIMMDVESLILACCPSMRASFDRTRVVLLLLLLLLSIIVPPSLAFDLVARRAPDRCFPHRLAAARLQASIPKPRGSIGLTAVDRNNKKKIMTASASSGTALQSSLQQFAPQAVNLFNNMKTPASILAGALVPLGLLAPLPPADAEPPVAIVPDGSTKSKGAASSQARRRAGLRSLVPKILRRSYVVVAVLSLLSELISVMWATVAVNQLIETHVAPAESVWYADSGSRYSMLS
jgi:hypothetical protein